MPDSFIAQALLGGQDDADDILGQSLAADTADSGKLRLTKALASLAQDPLFKGVLLRAQGEVDQFFTGTGQRKRGQGSRFIQASERVRAIGDELDQRKAELEKSGAIESEVAALRQRLADTQAVLDEANTALQMAGEGRARGIEREALVLREAEAKGMLEEIDSQKARLADMERDIEQASIGVNTCKAGLASATAAVETTGAQRRAAEEAVRVATGDEAVRQQELKKAQLEKRAAELAGQLATATSVVAAVNLALEARDAARAAAGAEATAVAQLDRATADRERALERERKGAVELESSRALAAFVRWRAAVVIREQSAQAQASARRAKADASTKDEEASRIERELADAEEKFVVREAGVPAPAALQKLRELERELEKAEAALGGDQCRGAAASSD